MFKEIQLSEIEPDGFLHSQVDDFIYDKDKKNITLHINFIKLKSKGSFYSCVMTITDWWSLEVYSYNRQEIVKHYSLDEIPEIDSILDFSYNNDELILEDCGMNNTAVAYKFTKPKIHITGEYDPD